MVVVGVKVVLGVVVVVVTVVVDFSECSHNLGFMFSLFLFRFHAFRILTEGYTSSQSLSSCI